MNIFTLSMSSLGTNVLKKDQSNKISLRLECHVCVLVLQNMCGWLVGYMINVIAWDAKLCPHIIVPCESLRFRS